MMFENCRMLRRLGIARLLGTLVAVCVVSACTSDAYNQQARLVAEAAAKAGEALKSESQARDDVRAEEYFQKAATKTVIPKIIECIQLPDAPDIAETCRLMANGVPFEPKDAEPAIRRLAVSWNEYFSAIVSLVDANNSEAFGKSVTKLVDNGFSLAEAVEKAAQAEGKVSEFKGSASAAANIIVTAGKGYELTRKTSAIKRWSTKYHPLIIKGGRILADAYAEGQKTKELTGWKALTNARQSLVEAARPPKSAKVIRSLQDKLRAEYAAYMSTLRAAKLNPFESAIAAHETLAKGEGANFGEKDVLALLPLIQELKQSVDAFIQAIEKKT